MSARDSANSPCARRERTEHPAIAEWRAGIAAPVAVGVGCALTNIFHTGGIAARSDSRSASITRSSALVLRVTLIWLKRSRWIRPAARAAPSATCSSLADVGTGFVRIADGHYLMGMALSGAQREGRCISNSACLPAVAKSLTRPLYHRHSPKAWRTKCGGCLAPG